MAAGVLYPSREPETRTGRVQPRCHFAGRFRLALRPELVRPACLSSAAVLRSGGPADCLLVSRAGGGARASPLAPGPGIAARRLRGAAAPRDRSGAACGGGRPAMADGPGHPSGAPRRHGRADYFASALWDDVQGVYGPDPGAVRT